MEHRPLLIVGAGCAGLSLAVHLSRKVCGRRLIVLDPRTTFARDRTWCFWRTEPHAFAQCVSREWTRWTISTRDGEARSASTRHPYQHIAADDFYRAALSELQGNADVQLRLGERVEAIEESAQGVVARTDRGSVEGEWAFDSRPVTRRSLDGRRPALLQHFAGRRIRFHRACLDPTTVTLMDFRAPALRRDRPAEGRPDPAIRFVYVLPFDQRTALVESTWLSRVPLHPDRHLELVDRFVSEVWPDQPHTLLDDERGVIPMSLDRSVPSRSRVVPIGLGGGGARPSSGYAFLGIQRQASAIAESLARGLRPVSGSPFRARSMFLDRVFLSFLARHPDQAPELFRRLAGRVSGDVFARFMTDTSSLGDDLAVLFAMPRRAMVRQATHETFTSAIAAWSRT